MKLEVGMYVRTKDGISKCIKVTPIRENSFMYEFDREVYEDVYFLTYSELEKYKSSSNIIDLIEVGDYVNGKQVIETYYKSDEKWHLEIVDSRLLTHDELKHVNIQSIVTKEQFESMKYSLEG